MSEEKKIKQQTMFCEKYDVRAKTAPVNEAAVYQTSIQYMVAKFCQDNKCTTEDACRLMQESVNRQDGFVDCSQFDPKHPFDNYQQAVSSYNDKVTSLYEAHNKSQEPKEQPAPTPPPAEPQTSN